MKLKIGYILVLIVLLGGFLRFYQLGAIPHSLNWDEVSWGYNAYSIATTGKDEFGSFLPMSFKAFGDYKQPVYVYLDALPTLVFGLSALAVRFPSALFGTLSIISVFFLVRELFYKDKRRDIYSLLIAVLIAISPWSIQFSRVAFEANIGVFWTITGAAAFLWGIRREKYWLIIVASGVLALSCYTYHSQKIFTPLLFAGLLIYTSKFWLHYKVKLIGILLLFLAFNMLWLADTRTTARGRSVMFTSNQTQILAKPLALQINDKANNDMLGVILLNRRIIYAQTYLQNYLSHFDLNYLFVKGDNPRHHPPGMGVLYLVSLPFILIGMVLLWKRNRRVSCLMFYWLLLAPLASSLAVDAPNASRSMVSLPTWQIFAGFGIVMTVDLLRRFFKPALIISFIGLLYFINVFYYTHMYFAHTDTEYASYWQYGYKEAVTFGNDYLAQHDQKLFFTPSIEQGYIFYLFYSHINPNDYIADGGSNNNKGPCFSIDKAYFGVCDQKMKKDDMVFSATPLSNSHLVKKDQINYPNNEPSIYIYLVK